MIPGRAVFGVEVTVDNIVGQDVALELVQSPVVEAGAGFALDESAAVADILSQEAPQIGAGDGGLIISALLGPLDLLTLHGNNAILAVNSDLALGGHGEGDGCTGTQSGRIHYRRIS